MKIKNYFENARVKWRNWNPSNIVFKSNRLIKKLLPEENVLSWTTKGDRDSQMCRLTGGTSQGSNYYGRENYKGVMVQLKDLKSEFPTAHIDFIDYTERKDSVGHLIGALDVLVYVNSFHNPWKWVRCPQTNQYTKKASGHVAPVDEGYRISIGGQGDCNPMAFETLEELFQISEAIRLFLANRVVPAKNGEIDFQRLMVA